MKKKLIKRFISVFFVAVIIPLQLRAEPLSEYYLLKRYSDFIEKKSYGYQVRSNKDVVEIENCISDECETSWEKNTLSDVVSDRFVIIHTGHYEWSTFTVIDLQSGQLFSSSGHPYFSPDLKKIAFIAADEMNDSTLEIYEFNNGEYKTAFMANKKDYNMPQFIGWNGNDVVRIRDDRGESKVAVYGLISYNKETKNWAYKKLSTPSEEDKREESRDFLKIFPDIKKSFADKKLVLSLLTSDGANAKFIDDKLLDDEEVMIKAVKSNYANIKYASERLRSDRKFMKYALGVDGSTFQFASEELRGDKDFVLTALNSSFSIKDWRTYKIDIKGKILKLSSAAIRSDEEIIRVAISKNDEEFLGVSEEIRNKAMRDKNYAIELMKANCRVFIHLPDKLRDNKEVLIAAVNNGSCTTGGISSGPYVFQNASNRLRDDIYLVRDLVLGGSQFGRYYLDEASDRIKKDKNFVLSLAKSGVIIGYSTKNLSKDDVDFTKEIDRLNEINSSKNKK